MVIMDEIKQRFVGKLLQIKRQDQEACNLRKTEGERKAHYRNRTFHLYEALHLAIQCGYKAGIRIDKEDPEWPVIFIELPTGQISYHVEQHPFRWDNHTNEEKDARLLAYVADELGV